jgi:predicted transcriptional regulator
MDAWEQLKAGATIPTGDAWELLQAQGGGATYEYMILANGLEVEMAADDIEVTVATDAFEVAVDAAEIEVEVDQSPLEVEI